MKRDEAKRLKGMQKSLLEWAETHKQMFVTAQEFQNAANLRDLMILARRPVVLAKRRS